MIGTEISHYRVTGFVGEGHFGAVYVADDLLVRGRQVAIKKLKLPEDGQRQALLRFEREARALSSIDDPNVVALHEYLSHGGDLASTDHDLRETVIGTGVAMSRHAVNHSGGALLACETLDSETNVFLD